MKVKITIDMDTQTVVSIERYKTLVKKATMLELVYADLTRAFKRYEEEENNESV